MMNELQKKGLIPYFCFFCRMHAAKIRPNKRKFRGSWVLGDQESGGEGEGDKNKSKTKFQKLDPTINFFLKNNLEFAWRSFLYIATIICLN